MPSWWAWVDRPRGLLKEGVEHKLLKWMLVESAWFKVENVLWERISVIDLNWYKIKTFIIFVSTAIDMKRQVQVKILLKNNVYFVTED